MKNILINKIKILLDNYLINRQNESMYHFCFRYIRKKYPSFTISQTHKVAQILAEHDYNSERVLFSTDGLPLNMDWYYLTHKIVNIYHNYSYFKEKPPGSFVVGLSMIDACNLCKTNIHNNIFVVSNYGLKIPKTDNEIGSLSAEGLLTLMEKCEHEICRCSFLVFNPEHTYKKGHEIKYVENIYDDKERIDFGRKIPIIMEYLIQKELESERQLEEIRKNRYRHKY